MTRWSVLRKKEKTQSEKANQEGFCRRWVPMDFIWEDDLDDNPMRRVESTTQYKNMNSLI